MLTDLIENNKKGTETKSLKAKIEERQTETTAFKGKELRRVFHKKEWYYCIADVIGSGRKYENRTNCAGSCAFARQY
jgi:hypothetical protein